MKHLGLFEGVGGFSLAARWAGWETVAWCEWNEFGQKVLKHYFPEAEAFSDIKNSDFKKYANKIDILTGGFPCQPYSLAGKRLGKEDDRHLWPEMLRAIREVQPIWVVGENVRGLVNWSGGLVFDEVQSDLEAAGYEVTPFLLPACGVNAPHKRDRVWFVAYSVSNGHELRRLREIEQKEGESESKGNQREWLWDDRRRNGESGITTNTSAGIEGQKVGGRSEQETQFRTARHGVQKFTTNTDNEGSQRGEINGGVRSGRANRNKQLTGLLPPNWQNFPTQSPVCGRNDGLPSGLVGITFPKWRNESIKAFGNAIVPQVAYQIFKAINEYTQINKNKLNKFAQL